MPSPFPGMNPYLEQGRSWHDFHERYIPKAAESITPQVRPAYLVRIDEHVYIHELAEAKRRFVGRADATVTAKKGKDAPLPSTGAVLEAPAYALLSPAVDFERHAFLEFQDRETREVITVIELLSPSNKTSDREQYLEKRRQVLGSRVHLVEIDLLRGGGRLPLRNLPKCDYYTLVSRAEERPRVGVWPIRLRDRLPVIPIPLREHEKPAQLDLQEILHHVYDAAAYEDDIYQGEPARGPGGRQVGKAIYPSRPLIGRISASRRLPLSPATAVGDTSIPARRSIPPTPSRTSAARIPEDAIGIAVRNSAAADT